MGAGRSRRGAGRLKAGCRQVQAGCRPGGAQCKKWDAKAFVRLQFLQEDGEGQESQSDRG